MAKDSVSAGLWWSPDADQPRTVVELALHLGGTRARASVTLEPADAVTLAYRLLALAAIAGKDLDVESLLESVDLEVTAPRMVGSTRLLEWLTLSDFDGVEDEFIMTIVGVDSTPDFEIPLGHLRQIVAFLEGAKHG